ncbi:hypothetical protein VPNG_05460 [Cytospora leucostoma]|uniref:Uncharacterized protein n=1 Tax=Cytospora leucostoma TaxID=1230097 RepID=A0A423XBJ4_9PEZI|nr:hypothetical protein VPNG_05460 [Cytospora leucostoma]
MLFTKITVLLRVLGLVGAHGIGWNATSSQHSYYAARNLATVQAIYDNTVYPNNAAVVQSQGHSVSGLFAGAASGRISPLGNFTGFLDSIEYFFGLAPLPQASFAGLGFFRAEVVAFSSECADVASSVVYLYVGPVNNVTGGLLPGAEAQVSILKQVAFWRFSASGAVLNYEAWIPTLELWNRLITGQDNQDPVVQKAQISRALCPAIQQNCAGHNQQYTNVDDCIEQLSKKTFGNFDELWGDNVVCRQVHVLLTRLRPDVHCPHVGPTGGGKCVNIDYRVDYFDDEKLYGTAKPFLCSRR